MESGSIVTLMNPNLEPQDDMEFDTREAAYELYKEYAKSIGLSTAKLSSRRSRASKEFIDAKFSFFLWRILFGISMPLNHPIEFLFSNNHFPLWLVVLFGSCSLAILHYIVEKEPPKTEQIPVVIVVFDMSVFWISSAAGEHLNCLVALGVILELSPALLGLTILAWGNSIGDLVADVAVAKAGLLAMAMAGCFAELMEGRKKYFGTLPKMLSF
ncbi:cation/calcium exchanger 5 [Forsythia ovata]|uniref:Cation/calcium exchanger 5 n=1 Tax=Forsythia ovata TaxID=205694 RepID=A0ABD1P1T3_9LAMI